MKALGMIEVVGMAAAVAAADTAVKSANVTLLGYELANGGGMVTIKFEGDVGATKAALEAASIEAERVGKVVSKHLIPRPHEELEKLIPAKETTSESGSSVKKNEKISISQVIEQIEASTITIDGTDNQAESFTEEDSSGDEEPESSLKTDQAVDQQVEENEGQSETKEVCNICNDPACTRKKGDLKITCIYYKNMRRNVQ